MPVTRSVPDASKFNRNLELPFQLRIEDIGSAMQDVYDFLFDVNVHLVDKGLQRLDDMLRKSNMSGMLSDMLTASLAKHSRSLVVNEYHNGHPDLIVKGRYPNNREKAGEFGVEVKTTVKPGGAVATHGARKQWLCVFVYALDGQTEPAIERRPMAFTEVYLGQVVTDDFRRNSRGELGTRTATLHADGIVKLRQSWVYLDQSLSTRKAASRGKASRAISK